MTNQKKTEKLELNAIIDPLAATVVVTDTKDGRRARFDVAGVPRVDPLLVGKKAIDVPTMVTRLCGLCPVTHHLAGMAALDQLTVKHDRLSDRSRDIRALLHYGSVVDVMAPRIIPEHALELKKFARLVMKVAGSPGHFPDVAIPGGVKVQVDIQELATLKQQLHRAVTLTTEAFEASSGVSVSSPPRANVTVSNFDGSYNPLGMYLKAEISGRVAMIHAKDVSTHIRESAAGSVTPRPEVLIDGAWYPYRVGPAARYRDLSPHQAQLKSVLEAVRAIADISESRHLTTPRRSLDFELHDGLGIGLVDGPRGLLIHKYEVENGVLTDCQILSPTAQNEGWLSDMLTVAVEKQSPDLVEAAIRAADPCLPCTSAPKGAMNVRIVHHVGE